MEENRSTGEIVVKNFEPIPDQARNEFDSFYQILRQLLVLARHGEAADQAGDFIVEYNQQKLPILLKSRNSENQIRIGEYDPQGIPRSLHATHLKFEALVRISHYDLAK